METAAEVINKVVVEQDVSNDAKTAIDPLVEYASKLQSEYAGSAYRAKVIDLAKEARREYEGHREKKKVPWDGAANYSMMIPSIIFDDVECKISVLLTGKGEDIIEVSISDPALEEVKEHIEGFGENMLNKGVKWHQFIPPTVHDVLLDGTVFVLPRYEEKTVKRGERIVGMMPINPHTGERIKSEQEMQMMAFLRVAPVNALVDEIVFKDQTVFRVINETIHINEVYGPDEIDEWGKDHPVIIKRWYALGELKRLSGDNGPYINIDQELAGEETGTKPQDDISLDAESWQLTAEQERKKIECYECWLPNVTLSEGDEPAWAVITYTATGKRLIRKQHLSEVYFDGEFPIKRLGLLADGKHFYCTPMYQKIKHHSKAINDLINQMIDTGTIEISPAFFYDPAQLGLKADEIEWYPGAMNPCTNPQAIQQVQTSLKSTAYIEYINLILGFVERISAVTSYSDGVQDMTMASGAGTAAGMRMLLNEAQTKRNYQTKSMRESLEELILTDLRLYAWYMPFGEKMMINGALQEPDIKALQGDYAVTIRISDSANNDMLARLDTVELFNLVSQAPFVDQVEMVKQVLAAYQQRNPDKFIRPEFAIVLQAVSQNPQVVQVIQQFMQQQAQQQKVAQMQQNIADATQQKSIQDVMQADAALKNNPQGLPPEKIEKAVDSIENSQAKDLVEAIMNKGAKAQVLPPMMGA